MLALTALILVPSTAESATVPSQWEQPAGALADQIAAILGPGQARLTLRNLSSIAADDVPTIRRLVEQALRAHGISTTVDDAANTVQVTLSENANKRLWIAEIVEGTESKIVIVPLPIMRQPSNRQAPGVTLHKQALLSSREPILAVLETSHGLIALEPEQISIFARTNSEWTQQQVFPIRQKRPLTRDPRGILSISADGQEFEADLPSTHCSGSFSAGIGAGGWTIHCHDSDDPWPIPAPALMEIGSAPAPPLKAFYNSTRDYFTGIVAPSLSVDLPAFYSAAWIPRAQVPALLINGIDGKFELIENGAAKPVAGVRDWGSDFAAVQSACGLGAQILASGSGPAAQDSLRAYDLPAFEAIPASAPLAMDGAVTALWIAPEGRSIFAVVRTASTQAQQIQYEVDRVTATCN